jgi:hypothetical protein
MLPGHATKGPQAVLKAAGEIFHFHDFDQKP